MIRYMRNINYFIGEILDLFVTLCRNCQNLTVACLDLLNIRHNFIIDLIFKRDNNHRHILIDQRDRAMFHLGCGITLGMNIGDFFQLQGTLKRHREIDPPSQIEKIIIRGVFGDQKPADERIASDVSIKRGPAGKSISKAEKNQQVAASLSGVAIGRQIFEGDILYSAIPEEDFIKLKKVKQYLKKEEIEVIKEIAEIKRKKNPLWGV